MQIFWNSYVVVAATIGVSSGFLGSASGESSGNSTGDLSSEVTVNVENFPRAESDNYMAKYVKDGAFGTFHHDRDIVTVADDEASGPSFGQPVIRMNHDSK